jgi:peptidoglycan/LPS O-acetylase OafA/YrhL
MAESQKLSSFEGLRGIAAIVVVLAHLRLTFYARSSEWISDRLSSLPHAMARPLQAFIEGLYNGTFAVWLFWIMSGFVLSLQFFVRAQKPSAGDAHDYLEDAFLRRYPRLLIPVCASVAFAYLLHSFNLMHNASMAGIVDDPTGWVASWYTFSSSAVGAAKSAVWESFFAYNPSTTYNGVLWTMQREFYGSLFLFAFLALLGRRNSRYLAYPLVGVTIASLRLHWLNAFIAGIMLCDFYANRLQFRSSLRFLPARLVHSVCASRPLAGVLWSLIFVGVGLPDYLGISYLLLGVAAVGLTLVSNATQRFLSSRLPMFLGKISFGVYLVHQPVLLSFSCWAYLAAVQSVSRASAALLVSAMTCVLSILLGWGLYLIADRPGIRISRWLSRRTIEVSKNAFVRADDVVALPFPNRRQSNAVGRRRAA